MTIIKHVQSLGLDILRNSGNPDQTGPHVNKGDKHIGREYFIASKVEAENHVVEEKLRKTEESSRNFKPQGGFELFSIDNSQPKRNIKISKNLLPQVFKEICGILFESQDIFS